jgi:hypothetical protein
MSNTIRRTITVLITFIVLASAFFGYDSLFGVVSNNGIGREALAAALGALFVVLATGIQLNHQQHMEIERHKKQKTYENRLNCYTDLLKTKSEFKDRIITGEKVEIVVNQQLLARFVCEQEETFGALETFTDIIKTMNDKHERSGKKDLLPPEIEELTVAYTRLASMLMLDLKDGFHNLTKTEKKTIKDIRGQNIKAASLKSDLAATPNFGSKAEMTTKRNTSKVSFKNVDYTKKLYVYMVMKNYVETEGSKTFSDLQKTYTEKKLSEIDGLNPDSAMQDFNGGNPFWLKVDQALAKKKKSKEVSWDRYWIEDDMLLNFSDGTKIAVRNGQSTESVEVFQKWCEKNDIQSK